ncbi:MAG: hypothetical protein JWR06_222, partial [Jatrophihabitans sp.]|nr:hypothetical protein [Jatrophihabitans sp.]
MTAIAVTATAAASSQPATFRRRRGGSPGEYGPVAGDAPNDVAADAGATELDVGPVASAGAMPAAAAIGAPTGSTVVWA